MHGDHEREADKAQTPRDAYHHGRVAEACERGMDAIDNALNVLANFTDDPYAKELLPC